MFIQVNKILVTRKVVRVSNSYLESIIIDLDYLLLVVLSNKDISHAPEMYCYIN